MYYSTSNHECMLKLYRLLLNKESLENKGRGGTFLFLAIREWRESERPPPINTLLSARREAIIYLQRESTFFLLHIVQVTCYIDVSRWLHINIESSSKPNVCLWSSSANWHAIHAEWIVWNLHWWSENMGTTVDKQWLCSLLSTKQIFGKW